MYKFEIILYYNYFNIEVRYLQIYIKLFVSENIYSITTTSKTKDLFQIRIASHIERLHFSFDFFDYYIGVKMSNSVLRFLFNAIFLLEPNVHYS